jgi:hypothetical protein
MTLTTANSSPEMTEFYSRVARGDRDAFVFLCAWHEYCHEIDDALDLFLPDPEQIVTICAHAVDLYCLPFFKRHSARLEPVAKSITGTYLLTVEWERLANDERKRRAADILRHCGNDMVYAVAEIVGGWPWRMDVMRKLHANVIEDSNLKET